MTKVIGVKYAINPLHTTTYTSHTDHISTIYAIDPNIIQTGNISSKYCFINPNLSPHSQQQVFPLLDTLCPHQVPLALVWKAPQWLPRNVWPAPHSPCSGPPAVTAPAAAACSFPSPAHTGLEFERSTDKGREIKHEAVGREGLVREGWSQPVRVWVLLVGGATCAVRSCILADWSSRAVTICCPSLPFSVVVLKISNGQLPITQ